MICAVRCWPLRAAALLAFAVFVSACASSRPTAPAPSGQLPEMFPEHSRVMVEQALWAAGDSLRGFEASGSVELVTPEDRNDYNINVRQRTDDSLLVHLSPGWGIVAARGLATRDSVFVYDRIHHRLYFGSLSAVGRVLPDLASLPALFDNLTGTFTPDRTLDWRLSADSSHYFLSARRDGNRHRLTVDPRFWRVIRYEVKGSGGNLLEERLYSNFRRVSGVYMPHEIIVRRPPQETQLRITYNQVRPNPDQLAFSFAVAPGVERISIANAVQQ